MLGELGHQQRTQRRQTGGRARLAQPLQQTGATPRQSVSAHAVRTLCEGCDGQVRTDAPARWRESLTFLRLTAGPTATDGAHPGCDGGATPGSHPSQPETQGILRLSAHRARTSVRRVRRVGSHPDELKNLRKFGAFRPPSATGSCELRTRNHGLSLAKYRAAPPVSVFAKEGPAISVT
jgi:hypothetical protein